MIFTIEKTKREDRGRDVNFIYLVVSNQLIKINYDCIWLCFNERNIIRSELFFDKLLNEHKYTYSVKLSAEPISFGYPTYILRYPKWMLLI